MSPVRKPEYVKSLVRELCLLPNETEWVEFKINDAEPKKVGEYISALSNSAALRPLLGLGQSRRLCLTGI